MLRLWSSEAAPWLFVLDELTFVKGWAKVVAHLREHDRAFRLATVILTGSSAVDLVESADILHGRRGRSDRPLDRLHMPMTFRDYVGARAPAAVPSANLHRAVARPVGRRAPPQPKRGDALEAPRAHRRRPRFADELRRPDELVSLLLERHGTLLEARPEATPGRFKERPNQAGSTLFVAPGLVEATLRAGFDIGRALLHPFARAAFMMFLVAEVHPFTDGNGRMARVMMNAELIAADQVRIIVPTVYRLNYLAALKGATHSNQFAPLAATLRFAQRYTARIDFSTRATADRDLTTTNAFRDPTEAEDHGIQLVLPAIRTP